MLSARRCPRLTTASGIAVHLEAGIAFDIDAEFPAPWVSL
jgi:hypothetical protein